MSTRPYETKISADPRDLPIIAELLAAALQRPDEIIHDADVARLRMDNPRRLGGPAIRRLVEGAQCESVEIGKVPAEWITVPGGSEKISILYFHGGAYVRGSLLQGRGIASALALATSGRTLAVDYRQAPEDRFPAPVEDGVHAYLGMLESGIDPASIVLAGDSCGGAIIVSVLLALRELGVPLPAGAISISPWADLTMAGASWLGNAKKDLIGFQFEATIAKVYLGGADPREPLASPIFADLHGLPPLHIITGAHERLYSDALALADAASRANVRTELQTYESMVHVFPMLNLRTGDLAIRHAAAFAASVTGVQG